jgi:hypothetical protein
MSWLGNWAWAPGLGLLITFALLLFPNGRLPSHRWRPVAWLSATSIAIICGPGAAWSWPQRGLTLLASNEEGLENAPHLVQLLVQAGLPLLLLCGLASACDLTQGCRADRRPWSVGVEDGAGPLRWPLWSWAACSWVSWLAS